jgi:hypothetical protein
LFATGGHPLSRYAAAFGNLPLLETGSGTVTVAAMDAAFSCGYKRIKLVGADFAYTAGKPYCRGTYLEGVFSRTVSRLCGREERYTELMFRTEVKKSIHEKSVTYFTDTLTNYRIAAQNFRGTSKWFGKTWKPFPAREFFDQLVTELTRLKTAEIGFENASVSILPLLAWFGSHKQGKQFATQSGNVINLALELIARYTGKS